MSTLKTINLQHPTAATANITLSNTGGIALNGSVSGGGMDLITPTSVVGSGVTLSGGKVSFSAATTVSVNGCFTSAYENYLLALELSLASGVGIYCRTRMRAAGVDASAAASYYTQETSFFGTTLSAARSNEDNSRFINADSTYKTAAILNYFAPQLATPTRIITNVFYGYQNASASQAWTVHTVASAYDGFTIYPSSSTITGTVRIYGLRNS